MRMLGNFMVDFVHAILNVFEDKPVIRNLLQQNLFEFGGPGQHVESCLDTPLVLDELFHRSMKGDTFYDLSQTYGHGLEGLYQHTEATAYVKVVFDS